MGLYLELSFGDLFLKSVQYVLGPSGIAKFDISYTDFIWSELLDGGIRVDEVEVRHVYFPEIYHETVI
jgi:hypothetical protein